MTEDDQNFGGMGKRDVLNNSRNNSNRMPSLPQSIKGSIGGYSAHVNQSQNKGRAAGNNMPLNIAANDITFSQSFNQIRKFGN